jgi:hypothetical protein
MFQSWNYCEEQQSRKGAKIILLVLFLNSKYWGNGIDIQGVSRLYVITAGGDFLRLCVEKSSYKHVSDFGQLRSYDRLKLRIEGNDY